MSERTVGVTSDHELPAPYWAWTRRQRPCCAAAVMTKRPNAARLVRMRFMRCSFVYVKVRRAKESASERQIEHDSREQALPTEPKRILVLSFPPRYGAVRRLAIAQRRGCAQRVIGSRLARAECQTSLALRRIRASQTRSYKRSEGILVAQPEKGNSRIIGPQR